MQSGDVVSQFFARLHGCFERHRKQPVDCRGYIKISKLIVLLVVVNVKA